MKKILISGLIISLFSSLFASQVVKSQGEVLVNGKKLTQNRMIKIGDFIETKKNSKIKFNIGADAFMAKSNTKFKLEKNGATKTLNVIAGGVLAVFKKNDGKHAVKTSNMTAGIRGTGVYLQHDEKDDKSYFCTCYGETHLKSHKAQMRFSADHHNMVWIKKDGTVKSEGKMLGHDDDDLRELEAFVGRIPEFDQKK
jgi:ribosomal protein S4